MSSWTGIYGMFALLILWVSYGTDLQATWCSNLAEAQVPRLYLVWHTPAHNICQNMWPPRILFSFFPCLPLPHHDHLLPLHPFLYLGSWIRRMKAAWKLTVTDRKFFFFFIHEIPQVDVCECRWEYKLDQMCLILLWNVITCSRNRHPPTENTGGRQI